MPYRMVNNLFIFFFHKVANVTHHLCWAAYTYPHFDSAQIPELAETPRLVVSMEMVAVSTSWFVRIWGAVHPLKTLYLGNEFVLGARSEAERASSADHLEQLSENFYLHCAVCAATEYHSQTVSEIPRSKQNGARQNWETYLRYLCEPCGARG